MNLNYVQVCRTLFSSQTNDMPWWDKLDWHYTWRARQMLLLISFAFNDIASFCVRQKTLLPSPRFTSKQCWWNFCRVLWLTMANYHINPSVASPVTKFGAQTSRLQQQQHSTFIKLNSIWNHCPVQVTQVIQIFTSIQECSIIYQTPCAADKSHIHITGAELNSQ